MKRQRENGDTHLNGRARVYVPLDIVDAILSHVECRTLFMIHERCATPSRPTLAACTLVCRAWKPIASRYLFRDIEYSFTYSLEDIPDSAPFDRHWNGWVWLNEDDDDSRVPYMTLNHLYDFLAGNLAVRRSIRVLYIEGYTLSDDEEHKRTVTPQLLTSIVNLLPNLRTLRLANVACTYDIGESPRPIVERPLEYLSVTFPYGGSEYRCETYDERHAARTLACFGTTVGTLQLSALFPSEKNLRKLAGGGLQHLRVQTLKLGWEGEGGVDELLELLSVCPEVYQSIKRLLLMDISGTISLDVPPFLEVVGPTLEEFAVVVAWPPPGDFLCLSPCRALRRLEIYFSIGFYSDLSCLQIFNSLVPYLETECGIVSRTTHPLLEALTFHLQFTQYRERNAEDSFKGNKDATIPEWHTDSLLDDVLVGFVERLGLKTVVVDYTIAYGDITPTAPGHARQRLEAMFPTLAKKGYLQLTYSPGDVWMY